MSRGFVIRLLFSALLVGCEVLLALNVFGLGPGAELPFRLERHGHHYLVHPRPEVSLPSLLRDGDALVLELMSKADRATIFSGVSLIPGREVTVAVQRGGQPLRVPVAYFRPVPSDVTWLDSISGFIALSSSLLLALLTLWRGRDWAAWGMCAFSASILLTNAMGAIPVPPAAALWLYGARVALSVLVLLPALYLSAETLASTGLTPRMRTLTRRVVVVLAVAAFSFSAANTILFAAAGVAPPQWTSVGDNALFLVLSALPVLVLIAGHRRASHEGQLRIRWVLWSTALLYATFVIFASLSEHAHPILFQLSHAAQCCAVVGYLYGVLRSRVVDISFVIDRALLFALGTALLFGIFALLEQLLHHFALGEGLGWTVQAVTALLLAMILSPLHRQLEHGIELRLFRRQRLAISSLRRLATECAFVERYERLQQIALERLLPHCDSTAIYERTAQAYERRASDGRSWPAAVDVDDALFVALRAERIPIDLEGVANGVAADGHAFPMIVGEAMTGVVICRPRAGEQFAPDLRNAVADVARSLGMSLYILRAREQAQLVADIASARIDESLARRRALSLMEGAA